MADDEPWTTLVIAAGEKRRHGRDPINLSFTLCERVRVTEQILYRGPFYGDHDDDCRECAELLVANHY